MTADSTVAEIEAVGGTALGLEVDVSDQETEEMVARILPTWPRQEPSRFAAYRALNQASVLFRKKSGIDRRLLRERDGQGPSLYSRESAISG
jgi:hypothetical protein